MRPSIIDRYTRLSIRRKIVTRALAIVSILLVVIILVTYYGTQVGNFVITVEGRKYAGLSLSDSENREKTTSRLLAKSLRECNDADYSYIPSDIEEGIGNKNSTEGRYLAYSFYLINAGDLSVNYRMSMNIVRAEKRLESIVRVMIIKDGVRKVYAKAREDEGHIGEPEGVFIDERGYDANGTPEFYTVPFIENNSTGTAISESYYDFPAGSYAKYTFVLWLDGWDAQETNEMLAAAIQTELVFKIID